MDWPVLLGVVGTRHGGRFLMDWMVGSRGERGILHNRAVWKVKRCWVRTLVVP